MGYQTKCRECWGTGRRHAWDAKRTDFVRRKCSKCAGTGHSKPYRVTITLSDAKALGYFELIDEPWEQKDKCCIICWMPLTGRSKRFCGYECRKEYLWRWWRGAHWQKRMIVRRDGPACRECGEVFEIKSEHHKRAWPDFSKLELDHIDPLYAGGTEHASNCQILCTACHKRKSIRERRR